MDTVIGIIVGALALAAGVLAIVGIARKRPADAPTDAEDAGRGPTGQSVDPVEGTPSATSSPHWDRRPEGREGPL